MIWCVFCKQDITERQLTTDFEACLEEQLTRDVEDTSDHGQRPALSWLNEGLCPSGGAMSMLKRIRSSRFGVRNVIILLFLILAMVLPVKYSLGSWRFRSTKSPDTVISWIYSTNIASIGWNWSSTPSRLLRKLRRARVRKRIRRFRSIRALITMKLLCQAHLKKLDLIRRVRCFLWMRSHFLSFYDRTYWRWFTRVQLLRRIHLTNQSDGSQTTILPFHITASSMVSWEPTLQLHRFLYLKSLASSQSRASSPVREG